MLFSLTFLPAILVLMRLPVATRRALPEGKTAPHRAGPSPHCLFTRFGKVVYGRRRAVLYGNGALALFALCALILLRVDSDPLRYFNPQTEIPKATQFINDKFNGAGLLCAVFEADRPDAFKSPELLREIEKVEAALESLEDVGNCISWWTISNS
jgi:predicted RND superfamily exporter protein